MRKLLTYILLFLSFAAQAQTYTLQIDMNDTTGVHRNETRGFLNSFSPIYPLDSFIAPLRPTTLRFGPYGYGVDAFSSYSRAKALGVKHVQNVVSAWNRSMFNYFYGYSLSQTADSLQRWALEQGKTIELNPINEADEPAYFPPWVGHVYDSFIVNYIKMAILARRRDANQYLIGPSIASFDSSFMRRFLADLYKCSQDSGVNVMPNLLTFHALVFDVETFNSNWGFYNAVAYLKGLLTAHPEYGNINLAVEEFPTTNSPPRYAPGTAADAIIAANRLGIGLTLASFNDYKQVDKGPSDSPPFKYVNADSHPILDGLLTDSLHDQNEGDFDNFDMANATYGKRPKWHVYKTDADMGLRGQLAYASNRNVSWDGMLSTDYATHTSVGLIANRQGRNVAGPVNVRFYNVPSYLVISGKVRCKTFNIPYGLRPLNSLSLYKDSLYDVADGSITVPMLIDADGAARIEMYGVPVVDIPIIGDSKPIPLKPGGVIIQLKVTGGKTISVIPSAPVAVLAKEVTSHTQVDYTQFSDNIIAYVQACKSAGQTNIWAYADYSTPDNISRMLALLNAAQTVGGITVTCGAQGANAGANDTALMKAVWNHPALYRIGGKPVFFYYQWSFTNYANTLALLPAAGISRGDYILFANTQYASYITYGTTILDSFRNGQITSPHVISGTRFGWTPTDSNKLFVMDYTNSVTNREGVDFMVKTYGVDGLGNFAVDKNVAANILENEYLAASIKAYNDTTTGLKKYAIGGSSAFYASVSFHDYGFIGVSQIWDSILAMPNGKRPASMSDATAADYVELSYVGPPLTTLTNGLFYIPVPSAGFHAGDNTRFLLTDHSGIQKFLRPWIDAYKNNSPAPVFTTEKVFAWYWMHRVNDSLRTVIPASVSALGSHFNQSWWNNTLYKLGNQNVPGIKAQDSVNINKIRMAAHLTAPGYLRIVINGNTYTSPLKSVGAAYWECPQALGTPVFSIVNTDGTTIRAGGSGLQAITTDITKSGWNPIITEIPLSTP